VKVNRGSAAERAARRSRGAEVVAASVRDALAHATAASTRTQAATAVRRRCARIPVALPDMAAL